MTTTTQTTLSDAQVDAQMDEAMAMLRTVLGSDGWRVTKSRKGLKARSRWFSVSVRYNEKHNQWQARLRDGMPRMTVMKRRDTELSKALAPVLCYARDCARFCDGRLGLFSNPSKSHLGHRLWQAVRPTEL